MEDERDGVGPGSSDGVSESSLGGKFPDKSPVENTGDMKQNFEEGKDGEIMVEVVGSDVFVDGVGGQKVGDSGFGETGGLAGNTDEKREVTAVEVAHASNEVDGSKMGARQLELSGSTGKPSCHEGVSELPSRGVVLLNEARDPGEKLGDLESGEIGALALDKDHKMEEISVQTDEVSNAGGKNQMEARDASLLGSTGEQSNIATKEVNISINESKDMDSLETWKPGVEVLDLGTRDTGDLAGNKDQAREETVFKATDVSNEDDVITKGSMDERIDTVVGGVDVGINKSADVGDGGLSELQSRGVGILLTESPGDERLVLSTSSVMEIVFGNTEEVVEGNSAVVHKDEVVTNEAVDKSSANFVLPIGEDKTCTAEKEELLMSNDSTAVLDRSGEDSATTLEATEAADSAQISQPVVLIGPIHDNDKSEIDGAVGEAGLVNLTEGEDVLVSGKPSRAFDVNMEVVESVEEKEGLLVESKGMDQQTYQITSNSLDDDEHCLNRCHETKHQIDDTEEKPLDCETDEISSLHQNPENDGAGAAEVKDDKIQNFEIQAVLGGNQPEITNQSLNATPADAATTNGQIAAGKPLDCEIGTRHQNPENYDGGGGAAEVKEDKVKFFEIQAVMAENQITNQSLNATPMDTAAIIGQIAATSQAEVVDEDVSSDKGKKTDHEILMQSPEFMEHTESQGVDVSTDTLQQSPKDSCLNVEMVDVVSMKNGDGSNEKGKKGDHQMVMQSLEFTGDPGNQSFDVCTDDNKQQNDSCLNVGTVDAKAVEYHVMSNNLVVHTQIRLENAAEECGFTQTSEQVDASGITETSYHGVGKHEAVKTVPTEVVRNSDVSITNHASVHSVEHQLGTEELASEANKSTFSDEETKMSASSLRKKQLSYLLPQENVKQFTQSDLVWGKVRSHPWWPAQIFSPEDASEKAVKHYKKDAYLVAYFGDGTFAWNHAPHLKPFMSHFSQFKNQTNSDAFRNAVNCALEEVSRRVELGLACSCIPKEAYKKIESQVIENAGICKESSHRYGVDQCTGAATFEPVKLLKYLSNLAPSASSGTDQLNLVIARAQLSSFYHYKGYRWPTEFHEADVELSAEGKVYSRRSTSQKSKHTAKDSSLSREDISSAELMDDREFSLDAESESDSEDLGNSAPEKESDSEDLGKSIPLSSGRKRKAIYSPSSIKNHQGKSLSSGGKRKAIYSPSSIKNHQDKSVPLSYGRKRKTHDYPSSTENHIGKSVPMSSGRKWKAIDSPSSTENYLEKSAVLSSGRKRKTLDSPLSTENYRGKSVSLSSDRKQKTIDSRDDRTERRWSHSASKLPTPTSQAPKPSFKIGECIRRVASQLKGSATSVKGKNVETATYGSPNVNIHSENRDVVISEESFSADEIFSQLKLLAQNPSNGHSLKNNVRSLIMDFRNSAALTRPGKKGKVEPKKSKAVPTTARSGEEFEFYEGNDSYWMDRTVLNFSEDELSDYGEDYVSSGAEESLDSDHRSGSRIRLPCGHYAMEIMELDEDDEERRRQESSPAELIMNFEERGCVPSEINLNKLFRRFGSLMESETEVDHESGRAKVIFKRGSDAEVARNSAEKFNIFGAATVEYEIGYSPVISVKILPDPIHQI